LPSPIRTGSRMQTADAMMIASTPVRNLLTSDRLDALDNTLWPALQEYPRAAFTNQRIRELTVLLHAPLAFPSHYDTLNQV
jgi:hypothetical protein